MIVYCAPTAELDRSHNGIALVAKFPQAHAKIGLRRWLKIERLLLVAGEQLQCAQLGLGFAGYRRLWSRAFFLHCDDRSGDGALRRIELVKAIIDPQSRRLAGRTGMFQ